jgi:hypothetical protein
MERKSSRWKIWPVVFLAFALIVIWLMIKVAFSVLTMVAVLAGALLLLAVIQRASFYLRRGRPRLVD